MPLHLLQERPHFLRSLVFVVSTPPSSQHYIEVIFHSRDIGACPVTADCNVKTTTHTTSPHDDPPHRYTYIHIAPYTGGRSSDAPRIEVGSIFLSPRSFLPLRPSGSSRMIEASQLETGAATQKYSFAGGPPWRKRRKSQSRVPLLRPEYILIYRTLIIRRLIVMD